MSRSSFHMKSRKSGVIIRPYIEEGESDTDGMPVPASDVMETKEKMSREEQESIDHAIALSLQEQEQGKRKPRKKQALEDEMDVAPNAFQAAETRRLQNESRGRPKGQPDRPAFPSASAFPSSAKKQTGSSQGVAKSSTGSQHALEMSTSKSPRAAAGPVRASIRPESGPTGRLGEVLSMRVGQRHAVVPQVESDVYEETLSRPQRAAMHPEPTMREVKASRVTTFHVQNETRHKLFLNIRNEGDRILKLPDGLRDGVFGVHILKDMYDSAFLRFICNTPVGQDEPSRRKYTFSQVQQSSDGWYDDKHGFIQIAFPTDQMSGSHPEHTHLVGDSDVMSIEASSVLTHRYVQQYQRFLDSLGLDFNTEDHAVTKVNPMRFESRVTLGNHCLKRISRVLRSTRLLGFQYLSNALFRFLICTYDEGNLAVDERTIAHWYRAKYDD